NQDNCEAPVFSSTSSANSCNAANASTINSHPSAISIFANTTSSNIKDELTNLEQRVQMLLQEKTQMELTFGQSRAKFREIILKKEGKYKLTAFLHADLVEINFFIKIN